jgi:hypothetical protein
MPMRRSDASIGLEAKALVTESFGANHVSSNRSSRIRCGARKRPLYRAGSPCTPGRIVVTTHDAPLSTGSVAFVTSLVTAFTVAVAVLVTIGLSAGLAWVAEFLLG